MRFLSLFVAIAFVSLVACNTSTKKPCGTPVAVFTPNMPHVLSHRFEVKGTSSAEDVRLDIDVHLELLQSGCEKPMQTYNFTMPKDYCTGLPAECAADLFYQLAGIDQSLMQLQEWSKEIGLHADQFMSGEPVVLGNAFQVRITQKPLPDSTTLSVEITK